MYLRGQKTTNQNFKTLTTNNLIKLKTTAYIVIKYFVPFILLSLLILWFSTEGFKIFFTENKYLWFPEQLYYFI